MENDLKRIPLVRLLLPFVIGILIAIFYKLDSYYPFYALALFSVCYLTFLSVKKLNTSHKFRWIFGLLIHINLLLTGYCLTITKTHQSSTTFNSSSNNKNQTIIGEIIEPPLSKTKTVKAVLKIKGVKNNNRWQNGQGKVVIYLKSDSASKLLSIGDVVSFEPKLEKIPPPKNPNEFDYRKYLSFHLIHQQAFLRSNNWQLVKGARKNSLFKIADDIRKYLIHTLEQEGLKDKELAVASALILGYKDDIDAQLKSAYSSAGAMHILAVSGLHVGVIFLIFNQLLKFFDKIKYGVVIRGVILIIILWSYALLTGLSPSVMRAATMFSFIVAAKMTKRNSNFFNTLAASVFALLIYNPMLIMEVGFQLSYFAVIGIVIIQPWVYNWFQFKWWISDKIWEITAVSVAAQIATFPLGLLYFHQFPNYFLLSNLIVIPLAFLILYLGLVTLAFSAVPFVSEYLALGLKYVIQFLNWSVNTIDGLPYSLSENIRFGVVDTWVVYATIIFIILLIAYRKFSYFLMSSLLSIAFLLSLIWINYNDLDQRKLIIYNIPGNSAINFIEGNDNVLISDIKLLENRSKLLFHVQNNWITKGVEKEKVVFLPNLIKKHQLSNIYRISNNNIFTKRNYFQFYNTKIAILDNHFKRSETTKKLNVDLLILSKNLSVPLSQILAQYNPKEIIIDSSNSTYVSEKIKSEAKKVGIDCWSVLLDGAYIKDV
jgi:competence protein ComEC